MPRSTSTPLSPLLMPYASRRRVAAAGNLAGQDWRPLGKASLGNSKDRALCLTPLSLRSVWQRNVEQ